MHDNNNNKKKYQVKGGKLPSKEYFFCQDEGAHDGNNDHHQGAKGSSKNWTFLLYHYSLDIV
jgi:prolyl oligopeptidase PreP (S9A serine peptidase family)